MNNKTTLRDISEFVLSYDALHYYESSTRFYTGMKVDFKTGPIATGQTEFIDWRNRYEITLGTEYINTLFPKIRDNTPLGLTDATVIKNIFRDCVEGLKDHEVGHVEYTDFVTVFKLLRPFKENGYLYFLSVAMQVINVIEDFYLEYRKKTTDLLVRSRIDVMNQNLFTKDSWEEYKKEMFEHKTIKSLLSFIDYMLFNDSVIDEVPQVWWDIGDVFSEGLDLCYNTTNNALRIQRSIELTRQLIDFFGMDEHHLASMGFPTPGDTSKPETATNNGEGIFDLQVIKDGKIIDQDNLSDACKQGQNPGGAIPQIGNGNPTAFTFDGIVNHAQNGGKITASANNGAPSDAFTDFNPYSPEKDKAFTEMVANNKRYKPTLPHKFLNVNDKLNRAYGPVIRGGYDDTVDRLRPLIESLVVEIKRIRRKQFLQWESGHLNGRKINIKSTLRPTNYRTMKQKNLPRKEVSVSFTIVGDTSSSMGHTKRAIVSDSMVVILEACHRLGIPSSAYYFNTSGSEVRTFQYKGFKDKHESVKYGAMLIRDSYRTPYGINLKGGNVDEINLDFIGKKVKGSNIAEKHIIIWVSDGATCGNKNDLKFVAQNLEESGVEIFAIGACDTNVRNIYTNYKIFRSESDLKDMPGVLTEFFKDKVNN